MPTKTTTHTPGPWRAERFISNQEKPYHLYIFAQAKTACVAFIDEQGEDPEQGEANARLIAAAPDLLESAKRVAANATQDSAGILNALLAAIAKAEGREARS